MKRQLEMIFQLLVLAAAVWFIDVRTKQSATPPAKAEQSSPMVQSGGDKGGDKGNGGGNAIPVSMTINTVRI